MAVFKSIIGFSAAANYASHSRRSALIVGTATIAVLMFSFIKHGMGLAQARAKDSIHELEGCLYTLHAVLDPSGSTPPVTLRLAVHVPVGEMLEQVTEYIGVNPRHGRTGRRFPANAGITGKAFRENAVLVGRRANDDYELYTTGAWPIREWNYTPGQARMLNPAAMEWMAVPFYEPRTTAVLRRSSTSTRANEASSHLLGKSLCCWRSAELPFSSGNATVERSVWPQQPSRERLRLPV